MLLHTKKRIKKFLNSNKIDLRKYVPIHDVNIRRQRILQKCGIDLVIDIGANVGQYAEQLREFGYNENIISFEPNSDAFNILSKKNIKNTKWQIFENAIGDQNDTLTLNITANSVSSSLLEPEDHQLSQEVNTSVIDKKNVNVITLDTFFSTHPNLLNKKTYLKIDTQGFEDRVLKGAKNTLNQTIAIEIEMSFISLYKNQILGLNIFEYLTNQGWTPVSFTSECFDPKTFFVIQNDVIFIKNIDKYIT